jgi:hypothetical protein
VFEANDIDLDILQELTENDLAELCISLGNRRRLMKAITEQAIDAGESARKPTPTSSGEAERRQVTEMGKRS